MHNTVLSIKILFIHYYSQEMLLQRRYEFILFPNYFITVAYYYRTRPILFLYFFSVPTFLHFKIFHCVYIYIHPIFVPYRKAQRAEGHYRSHQNRQWLSLHNDGVDYTCSPLSECLNEHRVSPQQPMGLFLLPGYHNAAIFAINHLCISSGMLLSQKKFDFLYNGM